jgi:hypothetical protein
MVKLAVTKNCFRRVQKYENASHDNIPNNIVVICHNHIFVVVAYE